MIEGSKKNVFALIGLAKTYEEGTEEGEKDFDLVDEIVFARAFYCKQTHLTFVVKSVEFEAKTSWRVE